MGELRLKSCQSGANNFGLYKECNPIPLPRVIFKFVMWFVQGSSIPRIVVAINRMVLICHVKIADDPRVSRWDEETATRLRMRPS